MFQRDSKPGFGRELQRTADEVPANVWYQLKNLPMDCLNVLILISHSDKMTDTHLMTFAWHTTTS